MKEKIESAINKLLDKVIEGVPGAEAMHIAQAILSLAHARSSVSDS